MKILVVDDTKSVHSYVNFILDKFKELEHVNVNNGQEALDFLATDKNIEVILLDWEMPVMNGPDTLVALRVHSREIPVIMMTTKNEPEDIVRALDLGASDYLMKPFTTDILLEKLKLATRRESPFGIE